MIRSTGLLLAAVGVFSLSGCAAKYRDFGNPMTLKGQKAVPAGEILKHPDMYDGKYVLVSGKVDSVCAAKGCWLRMTDEGAKDTIFVKFTCPVEGRLIPMEAVGQEVTVEGTLEVAEITEETARHYAEDRGAPAEEIAKIVGMQKQVRIASPSARVRGV